MIDTTILLEAARRLGRRGGPPAPTVCRAIAAHAEFIAQSPHPEFWAGIYFAEARSAPQ